MLLYLRLVGDILNGEDIIKLTLTNGDEVTIDRIDEDLRRFRWGPCKHSARAQLKPHGGGRFLHVVIAERMLGRELSEDERIIHFNGNKSDNRRSNLRIVSRSQAGGTKRKGQFKGRPCSSKYKGVYRNKIINMWIASIRVHNRFIYLGSYSNEEGAAKAYDKAAKHHFGDVARLNFPDTF